MRFHITDFMKFGNVLSYRLTVAALIPHHSMDPHQAVINFLTLVPAVASSIINTPSFRTKSITFRYASREQEVTSIYALKKKLSNFMLDCKEMWS